METHWHSTTTTTWTLYGEVCMSHTELAENATVKMCVSVTLAVFLFASIDLQGHFVSPPCLLWSYFLLIHSVVSLVSFIPFDALVPFFPSRMVFEHMYYIFVCLSFLLLSFTVRWHCKICYERCFRNSVDNSHSIMLHAEQAFAKSQTDG